jgi:hypothetical protein
MVALARNLDFFRARFLAGLTAVFVARLYRAPAGQVRTLVLLIYRRHFALLDLLWLTIFVSLPPFHHPSEQCSRGNPDCKCRRNRQYRMSLDALSCVIQKFLGSISTLLCSAPRNSHSILNRIGNRAACSRSPPR